MTYLDYNMPEDNLKFRLNRAAFAEDKYGGFSYNEEGNILLFGKAVDFIRNMQSPDIVACVSFMATYCPETRFTKYQLFEHYYHDSNGNLMFFETVLKRMKEMNIIIYD